MNISATNQAKAKKLLAEIGDIADALKDYHSMDDKAKKKAEAKLNTLMEAMLAHYLEMMDMQQTQTLALGSIANSFRRFTEAVEKGVNHYVNKH